MEVAMLDNEDPGVNQHSVGEGHAINQAIYMIQCDLCARMARMLWEFRKKTQILDRSKDLGKEKVRNVS